MTGGVKYLIAGLGVISLLMTAVFAQYAPRKDAIWARSTEGATITLDGVLNESVWSQAESLKIVYGQSAGLPTSGWIKDPGGGNGAVTNATDATVKFLVSPDNQLYLAFTVPDTSVCGAAWPIYDGVLMSIKSINTGSVLTSPWEYFLTWWETTDSVGAPPRFNGKFGGGYPSERTAKQKAAWDAGIFVDGIANDPLRDKGYVFEMRVALDSLGYDATKPEGEIIQLNFSIWDADYFYENDPLKVYSTRTSWQSFWNGNNSNVGRVFARPDVTVSSGVLPDIPPEVVLQNGAALPAPAIDGQLSEAVWSEVDSFKIRWDDNALRMTYPGVGPYRSGQFQPSLGLPPPLPPVLDPAEATIRIFFRGHYLYFSADINDQLVQGSNSYDAIDGIMLILGDRTDLDLDHKMIFKQLRVNFNGTGQEMGFDFLPEMVDSSDTEFGVSLKGNTTINVNTDIDEGFIIEMKVDLTYIGYPPDLGDKLIFMGVMLADGDSFDDPLQNYGTRTWWFRENGGGPATPWAVMDPNVSVGIEEQQAIVLPKTVELLGNYPNPFNPTTTLQYSLPATGEVELQVFDVLGRQVARQSAGTQRMGVRQIAFDGSVLSSGIYYYRIHLLNRATGSIVKSQTAKMLLVK